MSQASHGIVLAVLGMDFQVAGTLLPASNVLIPILGVVAIIAVLAALHVTLAVLLMRDRVRRAMCEEGLTPMRVRWRPFAYWAPAGLRGWAFEGVCADATGMPQCGRFWVSPWRRRVWRIDPDAGYFRKPLSRLARVVYALMSGLCLAFAIRTLVAHQLLLPRTRLAPHGVPVCGWPKNLLSAAVLCAAGELLLHVAYHYSRQTDERRYRRAARALTAGGWALFWLSLAFFGYQVCAR
jgi:hypothetical protein